MRKGSGSVLEVIYFSQKREKYPSILNSMNGSGITELSLPPANHPILSPPSSFVVYNDVQYITKQTTHYRNKLFLAIFSNKFIILYRKVISLAIQPMLVINKLHHQSPQISRDHFLVQILMLIPWLLSKSLPLMENFVKFLGA